jgi:hypothetical protein
MSAPSVEILGSPSPSPESSFPLKFIQRRVKTTPLINRIKIKMAIFALLIDF